MKMRLATTIIVYDSYQGISHGLNRCSNKWIVGWCLVLICTLSHPIPALGVYLCIIHYSKAPPKYAKHGVTEVLELHIRTCSYDDH